MSSAPLVVAYSRTGTTRAIAEAIAATVRGELRAIEEPRGRGGALGHARSAFEAITAHRPAIDGPDAAGRRLLVVGTPAWMGRVSSPVRSYLGDNAGRVDAVAFFATSVRSDAMRVFAQMEALIGFRPSATLSLTEREISQGGHTNRLGRFAEVLRERGLL